MKYVFPLAMIFVAIVAVDIVSSIEGTKPKVQDEHAAHAAMDTLQIDDALKGDTGMNHHHHGAVDISDWKAEPSVVLLAYPDPVSGWNINIKTENFKFTPEMSGQENRNNEGHAHIYLNNKKISRVYGSWFHLATLPEGDNEISVTLNTNDHSSLSFEGEIVEDRIAISSRMIDGLSMTNVNFNGS